MSIQPGDKLPEIALQELQNGAVRSVSIAEAFGGKDVVLFAVPGAFTPTCSEAHLPGFIEAMPAFRDLGVEVIGISVNDTTLGTTIGNLGMTDVTFPAPLFDGDTLNCTTEIAAKRESKSRPTAGIVDFIHRAYKQDGTLVAQCRRQAFMLKRPTGES